MYIYIKSKLQTTTAPGRKLVHLEDKNVVYGMVAVTVLNSMGACVPLYKLHNMYV